MSQNERPQQAPRAAGQDQAVRPQGAAEVVPTQGQTVPPAAPEVPVAAAAVTQAGHAPSPGWRRLVVRHDTVYRYDAPVEVAHHAAWLRPRDTPWQRMAGWSLVIDPPPGQALQASRDVFGNWRHGFNHALVHELLRVESHFQVDVAVPSAPTPAATPGWEQVAEALIYRSGVTQPQATQFALGSRFAPVHPDLAAWQAGLRRPGRPILDLALALNHAVHTEMRYAPATTDVATDALTALKAGRGVCQDFAHLMIGVLRSWGLAASYVSGYLLTQPPPGKPRLIGADASHAWVAVWCGPDHGWTMLDPTNDMRVGQDHVTLAWGRDYADVAPLRGVIRGGGTAPPEVAVTVMPVDELPAVPPLDAPLQALRPPTAAEARPEEGGSKA